MLTTEFEVDPAAPPHVSSEFRHSGFVLTHVQLPDYGKGSIVVHWGKDDHFHKQSWAV